MICLSSRGRGCAKSCRKVENFCHHGQPCFSSSTWFARRPHAPQHCRVGGQPRVQLWERRADVNRGCLALSATARQPGTLLKFWSSGPRNRKPSGVLKKQNFKLERR